MIFIDDDLFPFFLLFFFCWIQKYEYMQNANSQILWIFQFTPNHTHGKDFIITINVKTKKV